MSKNVLLGTLLGDSYLGATTKPTFRVDHCPEQLDYLNHIADILRKEFNKHVSVYYRSKRNIHCLYLYEKQFIEWRNRYYPNDKKSIVNILNDITDPITALAYWLMDDGCVHYSTKNQTYLSPRLLLATCSETIETLDEVINWFQNNFKLKPYISIQRNHKRQKEWPLLKFTVGDSYKLWMLVRHKIIFLPSMKHKFRIVESEFRQEFYRLKYSQESPTTQVVENVCRTSEENKPLEVEIKSSAIT